jgi:SAM-dependent methyltransferase
MRKPRFIAEQGRKPSGLLGRIVARVMAKETAGENEFALELLQLRPEDAVLEIGCGHGETLAKAAKFVSRGSLSGIDFSPVMHRHATRRHRRLVAEKRIEFLLGNSDRLLFDDKSFDKVFTVHTVYFWKTPLDHLAEARRVFETGRTFRSWFPSSGRCRVSGDVSRRNLSHQARGRSRSIGTRRRLRSGRTAPA